MQLSALGSTDATLDLEKCDYSSSQNKKNPPKEPHLKVKVSKFLIYVTSSALRLS